MLSTILGGVFPSSPMAKLSRLGFGFLLPFASAALVAATRDVVVYSVMTKMGRTASSASPENTVRCRLESRGYQELGAIYAGEVPAPGEQVERLVRSALTVNGSLPCRRKNEPVFWSSTPGARLIRITSAAMAAQMTDS